MAYDVMKIAPTDAMSRSIGAELQRTFDVGTWYHIYMQSILYQIGLLEAAEVPVVNKDKFLNGKADGVFKEEVFGEKVVLEIKTMNTWNYQKAVFRPNTVCPSRQPFRAPARRALRHAHCRRS